MRIRHLFAVLITATAMAAAPAAAMATESPTGGDQIAAHHFQNCTDLNRTWRHGVGRPNAHDHTSGSQHVTNFKHSTALYNANDQMDRDGDGIACEKL